MFLVPGECFRLLRWLCPINGTLCGASTVRVPVHLGSALPDEMTPGCRNKEVKQGTVGQEV